MCMSCALRELRYLNESGTDGTGVHYGARSGTAFENAAALTPTGLLVVTADNIADDTSTTTVLTVGGPEIVSTIDTLGDRDFVKVELVAGRAYEFGMFAEAGGPSGAPLADSYLEIYDARGNLITSADGGASTQVNVVNSGFDALLGFTANASGTYYINARAFDNTPEDGSTNGDIVGDYRLTATDVTDLPRYVPYYDPESPLYSLDWGSQVDGTVRNPDGKETGHLTGNAAETPDNKGETVGHFGQSTAGKNVIKIYFAKAGDVYTPEDVTSPGLPPAIVAVGAKDFEVNAVWTALHEFEKVADVIYVETQSRDDADFHYVTYSGTPGPGVSLLGSMSPPQEPDEGLAQFNSGDYRWNATNLQQGGFSFVTLIHEFGHGHGMAHPHDNGGRSGVMRGVTADGPVADYTTGDFSLNQGVFTMMSYQDGWQESPYGNAATDVGYGYLGGLMAFDIAVIQDKYGVNEDWATGNNTYVLKDVNEAGTFYTSIWDAGGIDQITYGGAKNANIDLRAATLKYENGGGGFISFANGIFGGYTIANGVTIENASSGSGNDMLIGNAVANSLSGGAGSDTLDGGAGADTLIGGTGNDFYVVDNSADRVVEVAGGGSDLIRSTFSYSLVGTQVEHLTLLGTGNLTATGNAFNNTLTGNSGKNTLDGGTGADYMQGQGGDDLYLVDNSGDRVIELANGGNDLVRSTVSFSLAGTQAEYLTLLGTANINATGNELRNTLTGNNSANVLNGGAGDDILQGFGGVDRLTGGAGADRFAFKATTDSAPGARDVITDFARGDKLDLSGIDAISGTAANEAFAFIGTAAFTKKAGELRIFNDVSGTIVSGDVNGDGVADFEVVLANKFLPVQADILL